MNVGKYFFTCDAEIKRSELEYLKRKEAMATDSFNNQLFVTIAPYRIKNVLETKTNGGKLCSKM
jgi:hypothetical protein